MRQFDRSSALISIHIPKTGGESFREILKIWFPGKVFFHYFDEKSNTMPVKHNLAPGTCIHGHFNSQRGFGVKEYYPMAKQFIAFLRDPFEVLVSRYFYVKRKEHERNSYREGIKFSLSDNINDYLRTEIHKKHYHPNFLDYFPEKLTHSNFKELISKQFIYIGIMEDYQFSVNKLAQKLSFEPVRVNKTNVSDRFEAVDKSLRDEFFEKHTLEYEVYQYIKSIYRT